MKKINLFLGIALAAVLMSCGSSTSKPAGINAMP